jgi:hypothetical protein
MLMCETQVQNLKIQEISPCSILIRVTKIRKMTGAIHENNQLHCGFVSRKADTVGFYACCMNVLEIIPSIPHRDVKG